MESWGATRGNTSQNTPPFNAAAYCSHFREYYVTELELAIRLVNAAKTASKLTPVYKYLCVA